MSLIASISIDEICRRGTLTDSDIPKLRRAIFGKDGIEASDIDALLRINACTHTQDAAWLAFFVDTATEFVVNELSPQGYVTSANAGRLMQRIANDGRVDSLTELELLVSVLDRARWAPESLVRCTLDQVKFAVIENSGPLRDGAGLTAGRITAEEVDLVRRILGAFGGDGNAAITCTEAEILFDIEDATAGLSQAPEWQDLFVKAIASVVMTASGYKVPTRDEALRREDRLTSPGDQSTGGFLCRMLARYDSQTPEERALARLERQRVEIITNEEVTESEATWLAERIGRDGRITANKQLLLAILKCVNPHIHPSLQQLVDRVLEAA